MFGAPLFVNDQLIGLNLFCNQKWEGSSYTGFVCIEFFEGFAENLDSRFIPLEDANLRLEALPLQQRLNAQRLLDPYTRAICRFENVPVSE